MLAGRSILLKLEAQVGTLNCGAIFRTAASSRWGLCVPAPTRLAAPPPPRLPAAGGGAAPAPSASLATPAPKSRMVVKVGSCIFSQGLGGL